MRVAVLASGKGTNLQALLDASAAGLLDARVSLAVSDRFAAPALRKAEAADVPTLVLPPEEDEAPAAYDARLAEALAAERPGLVVLAGFMRILGPRTLAAFPDRVVNVHPSLLPAFKGAHGVRDALRAGSRISGCTTHLVTADLDGGPIVLQAALPVRADDDARSLAARIHALEHQILPRTVQLAAEGRIVAEDGRARILPGPSWRGRVEPVPDAVYPDGF